MENVFRVGEDSSGKVALVFAEESSNIFRTAFLLFAGYVDGRLEEEEQKIAALRAAIEEGEASGYVEDFDFESHLEELKAKRRNND